MVDIFAALGLVAAAAAVIALVSGMAAMATDGEVRHLRSVQWMELRVLFQALAALGMVLAGVVGSLS